MQQNDRSLAGGYTESFVNATASACCGGGRTALHRCPVNVHRFGCCDLMPAGDLCPSLLKHLLELEGVQQNGRTLVGGSQALPFWTESPPWC